MTYFARHDYTGNGSLTSFSVGFPYISPAHIEVSVDGVWKNIGTDYSFTTSSTLSFTSPPASGAKVLIQRNTPKGALLTDFHDGSVLTADTLDLTNTQTLYITQEQMDTYGFLQESVNSSIVIPYPNDLADFKIYGAETATGRADKVLGFDSEGKPRMFASPDNAALSVSLASTTSGKGDALVGVLLDATGAVARTQHDKNADAKSLFDFMTEAERADVLSGAATLDHGPAWQRAVDSGVDQLFFPPGVVSSSVRIKPASGQKWFAIPGRTVLKLSAAAGSAVSLIQRNADGLEGSLDDWSADGLIFDGAGKDAAFLVYGCKRLRFTDCIFRNAGTYGCALQARPGSTITLPQDDIQFLRCGFEDNGSDAPGWDGIDIKWCTNTKLIGCWADRNTDVGINVRGKEVDIIGCTADGNATAGILAQSNDATEDSAIRIIGGGAFGTTTGPGLEMQGNNGRSLHVMVEGFQTYGNTGPGVRVSGSGKVYGKLDIQARDNTTHGLHVTGDFVGRMSVSGLVTGNGGNGVDTTGKNTMFDALWIVGNTGVGYRENTGADNNYLMPNCVIDNNTGGDVGTRVGAETADGFLSVRTKQSLRAFPGQASGLELQTDSGGTYSSVVAVGDAASIDLRLLSKGNGNITGYKDNGSRTLFDFKEAGSSTVNYPEFIASLSGGAVLFQAAGSDTNIDLQLNPKGSGRVRFGTLTTNADAPITGYIEVKDAGGTVRKLAVIA